MAETEELKSAQSQPGYGDSSLRSDASADAERSAALSALLARVEAAKGPDRYADCWLACALDGFFPTLKDWPVGIRDNLMTWRIDFCRYEDGGIVSPGHGGVQMVPDYTASLDAALALVERVLPGWNVEVRKWHTGGGGADLRSANGIQGYHAKGKTPALALLAALLKALIAADADTSERNDLARDDDKAKPSTSLGGGSRASVADSGGTASPKSESAEGH